jgi:long-chain acyl-CoA synthetase
MFNCSVMLEESVLECPDKTAVVCTSTNKRMSYKELIGKVNQLVNGLKKLGIEKGDRVLVVCHNRIEFPIIYYAVMKLGAVVISVNILSKRSELEYYLSDTNAKALLCLQGSERMPTHEEGWAAFNKVESCENFILISKEWGGRSPYEGTKTLEEIMKDEPETAEPAITGSDDTAVILYTSGTTGKPKGSELTHQVIFTTALNFMNVMQMTPEDKHLVALPLFHTFGQSAHMNPGFMKGAVLVLLERFDADKVLELFENESITVFCGVPTMYWALLHKADAKQHNVEKIQSTLRLCVTGGAAMPVEVLGDFEEVFGENLLMEGYGLTETSSSTNFTRLDRPRKIGSCGTPQWGVRVKIVDENMQEVPVGQTGELVIQGHCTMKGYLNRPDATEKAFRGGWFHTSDVGYVDEDGYYYIVDRLNDMIIRGGYNVYPREIEEKMIEHPDISLVAVIGVPHEQYGEEIMAFIILNEGATCTAEDIIEWTKAKVANYKYPRHIRFVDSIPMSATNKILKRELRKMILEESG